LYHVATSRLVKPLVSGLPENALEYYVGQSNVMNLRIITR
jgi:hypothetical protein